MESADLNKIVIASFLDDGEIGYIIIDTYTLSPYCDLCDSFNCIHVKMFMSNEQAREDLNEALRLICRECGFFNPKGSKFCIMCGSALGDGQ